MRHVSLSTWIVGLVLLLVSSPGPAVSDVIGASSDARLGRFDVSWLAPTEPVALAASVEPGQNLFSTPVTYGRTGVLKDEVRDRSLFGPSVGAHQPFPAGTPVFAVPIGTAIGILNPERIKWCARDVKEGADASRTKFTSWCFPEALGRPQTASFADDAFPAYATPQFSGPATAAYIEERAVPFTPQLTLVVQFAGWGNDKANLRIMVQEPAKFHLMGSSVNGEYLLYRPHLKQSEDGAYRLYILGGEIVIVRAPDGKTALIKEAVPLQTMAPVPASNANFVAGGGAGNVKF